jgi:hypothetical protein
VLVAAQQMPYGNGDVVEVVTVDGEILKAHVRAVIETPSLDPQRKWRLLVRYVDDQGGGDLPLYCGDDGTGERIRPGMIGMEDLAATDPIDPVEPGWEPHGVAPS